MNAQTIRAALTRVPFSPFEVHTTHGQSYSVGHPDFAFIAGNTLIVYYPDSERMAILSLLHVSGIDTMADTVRP